MQDPILKKIFANLPRQLPQRELEGPVPHRVSGHVRRGNAPAQSLVYASLAARKLRKHSRSLGESGSLVVVSMVLYHGAGPWNAPVPAEELVPGLTEYMVRPETADPDNAREEDIPGLVLGLLVPGQTPVELGRRLDALKRALEPGTDPQLRERWRKPLSIAVAAASSSLELGRCSKPTKPDTAQGTLPPVASGPAGGTLGLRP